MRHGIYVDRFSGNQQVVESTQEISLRQLLPTARFFAADDLAIREIAETAESCSPGDLVVYRIGKDDPSKLIADAMARGAGGILTEQLLPCPLPQCIVGDTEIALAKITTTLIGRPDRKLLTIGVIGSAGKTTTALLVSSLLRSHGYRAAYQTDLGDCDGIVQQTSETQIPSHSPLVQWLGEAVDSGSQAAIIELSDDQARHGAYEAIEFDMLIVAGGSSTHIDFGPSGIQSALDRLSDDGIVIAPEDDQKTIRLIRDTGAKPLTYSLRKHADLTAKIIDQSGGMTTLMVNHHDTTAIMETPLCGPAMAANHLAAALVGLLLGHRLEQIVEHLGQLREVPGRDERLVQFGQATVVIDAGGSPHRAATSLRTHRSMKAGGRLWCVLAIDGTDSADILSRYGSLVERFADHAVVTATSTSQKSFLSAAHAVLDGVKECAAMRLVANRRRAVEWAIAESRPDDTILVITGETSRSAHQQRSDIDQIKSWVETARTANSQTSEPQGLKIFK